jgi:hypothetical protein
MGSNPECAQRLKAARLEVALPVTKRRMAGCGKFSSGTAPLYKFYIFPLCTMIKFRSIDSVKYE